VGGWRKSCNYQITSLVKDRLSLHALKYAFKGNSPPENELVAPVHSVASGEKEVSLSDHFIHQG